MRGGMEPRYTMPRLSTSRFALASALALSTGFFFLGSGASPLAPSPPGVDAGASRSRSSPSESKSESKSESASGSRGATASSDEDAPESRTAAAAAREDAPSDARRRFFADGSAGDASAPGLDFFAFIRARRSSPAGPKRSRRAARSVRGASGCRERLTDFFVGRMFLTLVVVDDACGSRRYGALLLHITAQHRRAVRTPDASTRPFLALAPMGDTPKIVIFGSAVVDLVLNPAELPRPGRTVLAPTYALLPGGKGANQAYAAARAGTTPAHFVGCVGADGFADITTRSLTSAGVDVTRVVVSPSRPTACAAVVVDAAGENQICVGAGANLDVAAAQLDAKNTLRRGDVLLMQMEIPPEEVFGALAKARAIGAHSVLNVAPSSAPVPASALRALDFLVVNEHECEDVYRSTVGEANESGEANADDTKVDDTNESVLSVLDMARLVAVSRDVATLVTLGGDGAALFLPRRPAAFPPENGRGLRRRLRGRRAASRGRGDRRYGRRRGRVRGCLRRGVGGGRNVADAMRRAAAAGTTACTAVGARDATPNAETIDARAEEVEATGNWGLETPPEALVNAPGLAWGRAGMK